MRWILVGLAVFSAFVSAHPCAANFVRERTFQEKTDEADFVAIGTAISVLRDEAEPTTTFAIVQTLKGANLPEVVVSTYNFSSEGREDCCEAGATYLLFLRRSLPSPDPIPPGAIVLPGPPARPGQFHPIWGGRSILRVGARDRLFPFRVSVGLPKTRGH